MDDNDLWMSSCECVDGRRECVRACPLGDYSIGAPGIRVLSLIKALGVSSPALKQQTFSGASTSLQQSVNDCFHGGV